MTIYHKHNGDPWFSPVRAAGRRYCYIHKHEGSSTYLSVYYEDGKRCDVSHDDMSEAIKEAGRQLDYPGKYGIDINRLDTHSLRAGGANQLAEAGYSAMHIQTMGRWKGGTFK